jgi:hypothetical protein
MRPHGQPELRQRVFHAVLRSELHQRLGETRIQLGARRVGATGDSASHHRHSRLCCVRRWFGNFYTVANTLTTASDYTPFSIPIPVDLRLPGGGGGTVSGLYNLTPEKVGQVKELAQLSSHFGEQIENWHGVDARINARLSNLTVQGGTRSQAYS